MKRQAKEECEDRNVVTDCPPCGSLKGKQALGRSLFTTGAVAGLDPYFQNSPGEGKKGKGKEGRGKTTRKEGARGAVWWNTGTRIHTHQISTKTREG